MQVLVALSANPGRVLSRDDLIEACWDGRTVSDNAINRVISLLRRSLEQLAEDAVRLETITKVGYRLVVEASSVPENALGEAQAVPGPVEASVAPSRVERTWTRRGAAAGIAVAGVGVVALAFGARFRPARHVPDSRALDLYTQGQMIQKLSVSGGMQQAMNFYKQAVAIDPNYAAAWGALAIGYKHASGGFMNGAQDAYPRLMQSAARRALSLDPEQPDANLALIEFEDRLGSWQADETKLREVVRRFPNYWYGFALLDLVLQDVGRFEEAIAQRKRSLDLDSQIPVSWALYARGLHYADRDHEADFALDQAFARWPAHSVLWAMRYSVLIGSKRYAEAAAFARDPRSMPDDLPKEASAEMAELAGAFAAHDNLDVFVARSRTRPLEIDRTPFVAPIVAAMGKPDQLFELLEAYYFGGAVNGQRVPPPDNDAGRPTAVLFAPAIVALHGDPRHRTLLQRTGLEDYWQKSGSQPDYRRA